MLLPNIACPTLEEAKDKSFIVLTNPADNVEFNKPIRFVTASVELVVASKTCL